MSTITVNSMEKIYIGQHTISSELVKSNDDPIPIGGKKMITITESEDAHTLNVNLMFLVNGGDSYISITEKNYTPKYGKFDLGEGERQSYIKSIGLVGVTYEKAYNCGNKILIATLGVLHELNLLKEKMGKDFNTVESMMKYSVYLQDVLNFIHLKVDKRFTEVIKTLVTFAYNFVTHSLAVTMKDPSEWAKYISEHEKRDSHDLSL
jgi:hypothetical protein